MAKTDMNRLASTSRIWLGTKLALAALSILSCVVVLALSIALAVDPAVQSYIVVWTAPQAAAALLWSAADFITSNAAYSSVHRSKSKSKSGGSRKQQQNIHPGAHIAVQLLLSLGFGAGLGLTARVLKFALAFTSLDDPKAYPQYYAYYYGLDSEDDYEYYSNSYVHSMEALVAFLALLIIIHLFLFVCACVETIKRDKKTDAAAGTELQPTRLSSKDRHKKSNLA